MLHGGAVVHDRPLRAARGRCVLLRLQGGRRRRGRAWTAASLRRPCGRAGAVLHGRMRPRQVPMVLLRYCAMFYNVLYYVPFVRNKALVKSRVKKGDKTTMENVRCAVASAPRQPVRGDAHRRGPACARWRPRRRPGKCRRPGPWPAASSMAASRTTTPGRSTPSSTATRSSASRWRQRCRPCTRRSGQARTRPSRLRSSRPTRQPLWTRRRCRYRTARAPPVRAVQRRR